MRCVVMLFWFFIASHHIVFAVKSDLAQEDWQAYMVQKFSWVKEDSMDILQKKICDRLPDIHTEAIFLTLDFQDVSPFLQAQKLYLFFQEIHLDEILENMETIKKGQRSLNHYNLRFARLANMNFQGAHLINAHLEGADCTNTDFRGACMNQAHLEKGVFHHAIFRGTSLIEAHLEHGVFTYSDLTGAQMGGSHCRYADFSHANLTGVFARHAFFDFSEFSHAIMTRICLEGSNCTEGIFKQAKIDHADLTVMRLEKADMTKAHLTGADLTGTSLQDVTIDETIFTKACLIRTGLSITKYNDPFFMEVVWYSKIPLLS